MHARSLLQFALPTLSAPSAGPGFGGNDDQMAQMQALMAKMQGGQGSGMMDPAMMGGGAPRQADMELSAEAKMWITVYPIYFDAKRKYMKGCRRVAYEHSCLWPKSDDIQAAVAKLTLMHAHEVRLAVVQLTRSVPQADHCCSPHIPTSATKDAPPGLGEPWQGQGAAL